jgi:hypothetical protein
MTRAESINRNSSSFLLRAAPSAFVVFGLMFGPLFLVTLYISVRTGGSSWKVAAMAAGAVLLSQSWLAAFRLSLQDNVVTYRTLFSTRSLNVSDISSVKTEINFGRFGPPIGLVIIPTPTTRQKEIVVNMKVFRLGEMQGFVRALEMLTGLDIPFRYGVPSRQ